MYPSVALPDLVVPVALMKVFGVDVPGSADEQGEGGGGLPELLPRLAHTRFGETILRYIGHN